ncbi:hypothetical protein LBMAG48_01980 [Phycisphaerae bacterium]|jgi:hypothetical protein|nr:hypothetical protein LBMAG48_01980 [Phycisphaerae bacterium]
MPLYEYIADDGTVLELLRPMSQADAPVSDPDGKGRTFVRKQSTFSSTGGEKSVGLPWSSSGGHVHSGSCGCGKKPGSCGGN